MSLWNRVPRIVRRGAVLYIAYRGYQSVSHANQMLKLFSPGSHVLGRSVLDLDLSTVSVISSDADSTAVFAFGAPEELTLSHLVRTLDRARDDPRVSGLVVRGLDGLQQLGLAEAAEFRRAVQSFSSGLGGKPTMLHVPEGIGMNGNGTISLYIASAFDSAHIQPNSGVIVPGISMASTFVRGTLDKIGVSAKTVARKEYKTAANMFTETEFTPAHKESTESLLDTMMDVLVSGISEGRGIAKEKVLEAVDSGIMTAEEAIALNLIDKGAYRDELPAEMRSRMSEVQAARYKARKAAADDWKTAMSGLVDAWVAEDHLEFKRWRSNKIMPELSTVKGSLFGALVLYDPTYRAKALSKGQADNPQVLEAELRALRAHLAWMETRPWEGVPKEKRSDTFLYSLGHVAGIVEAEMKLCRDSIVALESSPQDIDKVRSALLNGEPIDIQDFRHVIRWARALCRAKAYLHRVSTLTMEFLSQAEATAPPTDEVSEDNAEAPVDIAPCFFLLHESGDSLDKLLGQQNELQEGLMLEKNESETFFKEKLRYTKIQDYMRMLAEEKQVSQRQEMAERRSKASAFPELKDIGYLDGLIDAYEQYTLTYLANHKSMFVEPWRLSRSFSAPVVAVIHVNGPITDDSAEELRANIRRADRDPRVDSIVMRIDSPGGSATASELISRAVDVAKKPVVASMGNVCASGGYFIAAPCDVVFAEEATITGSIGVIFSTFQTAGLFEKIGLTVDSVERGKFAKHFGGASSVTEWGPEFSNKIDKMIDHTYSTFVSVAAKGRGMQYDVLEKVARGRVWSGADAKRLSLIDEFGGLSAATKRAAALAGASPTSSVIAVSYPTPTMNLDRVLRMRGVLPSALNEEGDEITATHANEQDSEDSPEDNDDDDDDDASEDQEDKALDSEGKEIELVDDPQAASEKDGGRSPQTDLNPLKALRRFAGDFAELRPKRELDRVGDAVFGRIVLALLRRADDNMLGANPYDLTASVVTALAAVLPLTSSTRDTVLDEIKIAAATAGRPATVMSRRLKIDDGKQG